MSTPPQLLSVLATGIAGRAHLHEKLDASEAAQAVERCLKRVGHTIETFEGRVTHHGGDEVVAEFDTTADAFYAAIEMQQQVAGLPAVSGVKMSIRAGLSCGALADRETLTREAVRLLGLARPGQSLAAGRIAQALPETLRARAVEAGERPAGESGRSEPVVEIAAAPGPAKSAQGDAWLCLRYGGNTLALDERRPAINMGRDGTCEVVIRDGRASRRHATIKRRGDLIVLIDKSRNGTWVSVNGGTERFVRESECVLHGKGVIAFAASASEPEADCAEFECGKS